MHTHEANCPGTVLSILFTFQRTICCLCIAIITILVAAEVVVRSSMNITLGFAHEVSNYLLVAAAFFGFAVALADEKLFRIDLISDRLPTSTRYWLELAFDLLSLLFAAIVFWYLLQSVGSSFRSGARSATSLGMPLYIPQAMMPFGMFMMMLTLAARIYGRLRPRAEAR